MKPVTRKDISTEITTRNKYYIAHIKVQDAEFGTYSYHPQEVADFLPGVFAASPDALPVTILTYASATDMFSAMAIFGYVSTTTLTPMSITVHTDPVQTIFATNMLKLSLRSHILSIFPFSKSSRTPYYIKGYLENPANMPQGKVATNFSKSFVTAVALALKRLEERSKQ